MAHTPSAQGAPEPRLFPVQRNASGTALSSAVPVLFQPIRIRAQEFQNRIWVSPMCQYSCACRLTSAEIPGKLTSHHYTHYTSLILRGPSLTIIEATAVTPNGRISPHDSGLWCDEQIPAIKAIVAFAQERGQKVGIQLAHAGRKASTRPPWALSKGLASQVAEIHEGGWPNNVVGPSTDQWDSGYPFPRAMRLSEIRNVVSDFRDAARRAIQAGVSVIEIHAAHGYLLGSFLSRVSNKRTDQYGGSDLGPRMKFLLEVVDAVRDVIPIGMPLLVRISATEWLQDEERAWTDEETVRLAMMINARGVDMLTLSSGGNSSKQKVPRSIDYQTNIAKRVRQRLRAAGCDILIGAVGRISESKQAEGLLSGEEPAGDMVLVGRQFLKEPSWALRAAQELGVKIQWPVQYQLGRYGLETKL